MDFLPGKTCERVIRHFLECLAPLLPYFLTGALVVFLTIIFMPAGDFILFCLLFLLVHVLQWGRMGLFRLLMLILGLPSHENLLKSNISFASRPALMLDRNTPASLQMPCGSADILPSHYPAQFDRARENAFDYGSALCR